MSPLSQLVVIGTRSSQTKHKKTKILTCYPADELKTKAALLRLRSIETGTGITIISRPFYHRKQRREAKMLFGSTRSGGQTQYSVCLTLLHATGSMIKIITHCQTTHFFGALSKELHSKSSSPSLHAGRTLICRWKHELHGRYWQFGCLAICNLDLPVD